MIALMHLAGMVIGTMFMLAMHAAFVDHSWLGVSISAGLFATNAHVFGILIERVRAHNAHSAKNER